MGTAALCITAIIAILAFVVLRINRADDTSDEIAYGDVAFIPEGMAATHRKTAGGEGCNSGQPPELVVVALHDRRSPTR